MNDWLIDWAIVDWWYRLIVQRRVTVPTAMSSVRHLANVYDNRGRVTETSTVTITLMRSTADDKNHSNSSAIATMLQKYQHVVANAALALDSLEIVVNVVSSHVRWLSAIALPSIFSRGRHRRLSILWSTSFLWSHESPLALAVTCVSLLLLRSLAVISSTDSGKILKSTKTPKLLLKYSKYLSPITD